MVLLGLVRAVALLRRGTGASWRDAIGAFFIWQSTSLVVARASVLALFAKKAAFLRTPKTSEQTRWWEALRANWAESTLALFGFAGIAAALSKYDQLSGPLLAGLLLFPTLGMAAAPVNSWAARRAALPAWLRERRRTEYRRDRRTFAAGVATGGAVAILGVAIAALALLFTGHQATQSPNLVGPGPGHLGLGHAVTLPVLVRLSHSVRDDDLTQHLPVGDHEPEPGPLPARASRRRRVRRPPPPPPRRPRHRPAPDPRLAQSAAVLVLVLVVGELRTLLEHVGFRLVVGYLLGHGGLLPILGVVVRVLVVRVLVLRITAEAGCHGFIVPHASRAGLTAPLPTLCPARGLARLRRFIPVTAG